MVSFLESVGVTFIAALLTACWHQMSRNEKPDPVELAIGFDLIVATMVLLIGFLPGSKSNEATCRLAGVVLLFIMLSGMTMLTRLYGYEKSKQVFRRDESAKRPTYLTTYSLKSKAAWATSIFGSMMLCAVWWLNANIGLIVHVRKH